jgi:hypothetical protein
MIDEQGSLFTRELLLTLQEIISKEEIHRNVGPSLLVLFVFLDFGYIVNC